MSGEKGGAPPSYPPQYGQPLQQPPPGYDSVPQYQPYGPPSGAPMYMYQGGHPHYQAQMSPGQTQVLVVPPPQTFSEPPPPDYMNRAIFTTICCFWPVGIFAIMKASEAKNAYARGDFLGAKSNSDSARRLSNIAIFAGVASIVVSMIIVGVYVGLIMTNMRSY
ncbi:proline-rich transmembrane protein 1-like [Mizuhopecten yessoensis]|uniref:Proline-rich transmembrane protein 1 n=1 Tax=Mizuhopecten yessoensis TaxID=6573 RepID=A0A210PJ57_MIZYE|nr:proline-rich transmembrane protein 1-like [Mizuhopecten yessoensis]OWF36528.1 Proline-rich transmembrane protein 1 [Mizuhopecten yessoensis]